MIFRGIGLAVLFMLIVILLAKELIPDGYDGRFNFMLKWYKKGIVPLMVIFVLMLVLRVSMLLDGG